MGIEIGTGMLTKALAGTTVGAGAGAALASRQDNEPPDKGIAKMQADANAMVANSGVTPRTAFVDFTSPRQP